MPSKKRKYEARFPPARIKKIMQTDEEIGKVAAAVPVIISRSLEIFLQSLVETTAQYTNERKAKTMTTAHLKHCIEAEGKFDFLKDLVASIADIATQEEEEGGEGGQEKVKKTRKPRTQSAIERKKKKKDATSDEESEPSSDNDEKQTSNDATAPPPSSLPSTFAPMTSSAPLQSSHSIDSIMGNASSYEPPQQSLNVNQPIPPSSLLPPSGMLPSFNTLQGSIAPSIPPMSSIPMQMNLPVSMTTNNDEDDDYDT